MRGAGAGKGKKVSVLRESTLPAQVFDRRVHNRSWSPRDGPAWCARRPFRRSRTPSPARSRRPIRSAPCWSRAAAPPRTCAAPWPWRERDGRGARSRRRRRSSPGAGSTRTCTPGWRLRRASSPRSSARRWRAPRRATPCAPAPRRRSGSGPDSCGSCSASTTTSRATGGRSTRSSGWRWRTSSRASPSTAARAACSTRPAFWPRRSGPSRPGPRPPGPSTSTAFARSCSPRPPPGRCAT